MQNFRFLEWEVYRDAKEIVAVIMKLVHQLPQEYRFELGNQIIRSSFSIVLNIAEGSGKSSDKELNRFLNIALGSIYETLAAVDVLRDNRLITEVQFDNVLSRLQSISNQLGGFKKTLKKSSR